MRLAVNKLTALRIMREARASESGFPRRRTDLLAPDPSPRRRWTKSLLPLDALCLVGPPSEKSKLDVAVPCSGARLKASFASNTVYEAGLPAGSFLEVSPGLLISCPELLFIEMANVMDTAAHVLLGYELCGTFSRDAADPREGGACFDCAPLTSVEKIAAYMDSCHQVIGVARARQRLAYVANNAWSPMEAILATMLCLPVAELGYGLGHVILNPRYQNPCQLVERGCATSRVPDIEVEGFPVGFNYDGRWHFDLDSIAFAEGFEAQEAARRVHDKYVDDLRRNRELLACGHLVMPVCSDDLFAEGGLDVLVLEALLAAEKLGERVPAAVSSCIESQALSEKRQELLWSLLPWREGRVHARQFAEWQRRTFSRTREDDCAI